MMRAGLALGSNLGDKSAYMKAARDLLTGLHQGNGPILQSGLYRTAPVDCPQGVDDYLNAVIEIGWNGTATALLDLCQEIERRLDRIRTGINGEPRTVDIDLLYVGLTAIDSPALTLPHPRMHQRKFVLAPLNDIRSDLIPPGQTATVSELLGQLDQKEPDPELLTNEW